MLNFLRLIVEANHDFLKLSLIITNINVYFMLTTPVYFMFLNIIIILMSLTNFLIHERLIKITDFF